MVAWAAVIPAIKTALPYVGKAIGALGAAKNLGGLFGGNSSQDVDGSGITYNAQVYGGQVPVAQNNMYSMITGQRKEQPSFYNRLIN